MLMKLCVAKLQAMQLTSRTRYLYASERSFVQLSLSTKTKAAATLALQWTQWGLSRVQVPAMH